MYKNALRFGILSSGILACSLSFAASTYQPQPMAMPANHDTSAFYLGAQLGYARLNYSKSWFSKYPLKNTGTSTTYSTTSSVDDTGFAGRVFLGYQFNQYGAVELGGVYLPEATFNKVGGTTTHADLKQYSIDLLAKGTLPLGTAFGLYAKGGLAWIHRDDLEATISGTKYESNITKSKVVPVLGAGAEYNFTDQFTTDISYLRYFPSGNLRATDLYSVGFTYKFI